MASELRVNTLKDASGNNSVATSTVAEGTNKCWVKFNQVSDANSIADSFNTSSVNDVSTGRATWNVSNAFANTNGVMYGATARTTPPNFSGGNGNLQTSTSQWEIFTITNATSTTEADAEWGAAGIGDLA